MGVTRKKRESPVSYRSYVQSVWTAAASGRFFVGVGRPGPNLTTESSNRHSLAVSLAPLKLGPGPAKRTSFHGQL